MIALGIVGPGANAAKFCGRRLTPDTIYVLTHGDEGVLYAPANHLFTISCVSHEALDRALQTLAQAPISRFLHTGSLPLPVVFMPPLRRVLDEACMPSPLPDHVLVERAISALCLILTTAGPMSRTSLASRNYQRYVRKARAYLCDHPGESPGLETLCRVTGVGARTLETAFREVIGLSPLQFSKVRRLNAARHVLANADPEEASVKSVATSHGFFHFGRFARDYKSLFGESPSATLSSMLLMPRGKPLGLEHISSAGIQVRTGLPAYPAY
jgi:AraC-like DNA-binding protein